MNLDKQMILSLQGNLREARLASAINSRQAPTENQVELVRHLVPADLQEMVFGE